MVTTDSRHSRRWPRIWYSDVSIPDTPRPALGGSTTYIAADEGWVYLAAVIDLFSRQVVGWSMQAHNY